jgi:hypothetical protein
MSVGDLKNYLLLTMQFDYSLASDALMTSARNRGVSMPPYTLVEGAIAKASPGVM